MPLPIQMQKTLKCTILPYITVLLATKKKEKKGNKRYRNLSDQVYSLKL